MRYVFHIVYISVWWISLRKSRS